MEAKELSKNRLVALWVSLAERAGKASDTLKSIENVLVALGAEVDFAVPHSFFAEELAKLELIAAQRLRQLGHSAEASTAELLARRMVSHG